MERDARRRAGGPSIADVEALADVLSDGLAVSRDGRILWASTRLRELCGRADLAGESFDALFEGDERPEPGRPVACRLRREGEPRSVEVRSRRLAGRDTLWVVRDLTHVRALEEEVLAAHRRLHAANRELERARERARRESEEREDLLTVVAHELRTPTTVISGYNKLLLSEKVGPLSEEQRRFLRESTKSCQRLNAFIGNLLEVSRQAVGDAPLEVCEAPLTPTLEGVAAFLKPLLEEHGLSIEIDLDPRAAAARFDAVRIERVLTNLVANAIQYAPAGSAIQVATRPVERDGLPFVEVAVRDEGPGVLPEDRERIFLPYVRAGASRNAGGLGLGLAICKRLVEAHGGAIRVEPGPEGGSRFAFTLPAPSRAGDEER